MASWATLAGQRAEFLQEEIDSLRDQNIPVNQLDNRLADVRTHHIDAKHGLVDWLTGNQVNESWSELHRIEEHIDGLKTSVAEVVTSAEQHIREELPRKRANDIKAKLRSEAKAPPGPSPNLHTDAVAAIHEAHRSAEIRHESQRNQQRGMVLIAAGLFIGALILLVLQATALGQDRLVPLPSNGTTTMSAWALLSLVMLLGMLGGAVSALLSLYITSKKFTNTLYFDARPGLVIVKVVLGLWTAVIGVLAVSTGEIVGAYTSLASVLLLAFLFGYGQQIATTFIDRRVATMLEGKP